MSKAPYYHSMKPFVHWTALERPIAWHDVFGRAVPLHVEIGFGNGEYLVRNAQAHPEVSFVGIEPEWTPVQRLLRRIHQRDAHNVRVLQADARVALGRLFEPGTLDHIYCLFPCPWPKKKHIKFRLFSTEFLRVANSRLGEGRSLRIVTDSADYRGWILDEQIPDAGFEVREAAVGPGFDTKYERKWREGGQNEFFEIILTKSEHIEIPLEEDQTMQTHLVETFDPSGFDPEGAQGEMAVEFKDRLYDAEQRRMVVRTFASEPGLTQDFWMEIVARDDGWRVRPLRGTGMIPTASVQHALDLLADRMRQHP